MLACPIWEYESPGIIIVLFQLSLLSLVKENTDTAESGGVGVEGIERTDPGPGLTNLMVRLLHYACNLIGSQGHCGFLGLRTGKL
jgi:hypothetical protein